MKEYYYVQHYYNIPYGKMFDQCNRENYVTLTTVTATGFFRGPCSSSIIGKQPKKQNVFGQSTALIIQQQLLAYFRNIICWRCIPNNLAIDYTILDLLEVAPKNSDVAYCPFVQHFDPVNSYYTYNLIFSLFIVLMILGGS